MANMSFHIANLLDKMLSTDKDFRFMATNDLMTELQKNSIKLDDESEKKVVKMLLKLLEDQNGEVQNLAVKCLGPLVAKVKESQVETIVDTLCTNMMSEKEQLRDISSIGLKTVILELPPVATSLAASISRKITGRLTDAVTKQDDVSVQLEAFDILTDLLSRFGALLVSFHSSIQTALLSQLSSKRPAVCKRSIKAIGHLVLCSNNVQFDELMQFLLKRLDENSNPSTKSIYIQCVGRISREAGHRVGEYLQQLIPLIINFCNIDDDELREYSIEAFEYFILKCPKEITSYVSQIIDLCLEYLSYDPNYNYGDDEDEADDMEVDEDDEDDLDDDYSDDDDMSCKVRRASAKCLNAVVSTRHHMLAELYTRVSPPLIQRFKEREENVKSDIFAIYISLLRQTKLVTIGEVNESHPLTLLRNQLPMIVKGVTRQLKEKSFKTRQSCFLLLSELSLVLTGCLSEHITSIMPGINYSLTDKNSSSTMKIDTLSFLNTLIANHPGNIFHDHLGSLVPGVVNAVADNFYKIVSEALLVAQQLVQVLRPLKPLQPFNPSFLVYVKALYECTLARLKAADIDQEVKERAISCMGRLLCNLGDCLGTELTVCLPIFVDRLRNEITRLTTVKSLTLVASSPLSIALAPILPDAIPILSSFLRKNHRALKLATLQCLDVIMQKYSSVVKLDVVAQECAPLINESDLHISQLTLTLLTSMCKVDPQVITGVRQEVISQVLFLTRSPLLQGSALTSMLQFLRCLAASNTPGLQFTDLIKLLTDPIYHPESASSQSNTQLAVHKQAFHSIARCVAALALANDVASVVNEFMTSLSKKETSDSVQVFCLLTLGEIGRYQDMSAHAQPEAVILNAFSSANEDIKTAASYALGAVAVGNLSKYLPFVLKEIDSQTKRQYLLLHSLKEIISCESNSQVIETFKPHISNIWSMLMSHCECPEEGTRNVVAECLGKLTLLQPDPLLARLKDQLGAESPLTRATVITAVKFTITDQPQDIDCLLKTAIRDFLATLKDTNLDVRRVALVMFNSAAHNKPMLIRDLLVEVLPLLYNETKIRRELIREVEMGPFKHTVDDGLDLRKAAFECMYTLLDACLDRIDIFEFLTHVEDGLKDHYDVKMLTYLMVVRLASLAPGPVLQRVERLIDPLKQTCNAKVKSNSVKQEYEKQDELKRSALRAVMALQRLQGADSCQQLIDFLAQIKCSEELSALYEMVEKNDNSNVMMGAGEPRLMEL
ncbi:cullin-associated NEDD8-dissociated protein 1-like [Watersipora subatra]|uniref:cullin-associated NEDD8-dissociated protein 1-like n=1 Tax=Watersipora subatra TaxID=2589382 RepID=UPI00355B80D9